MTVITYVDTETRNDPIVLDEPFELTIAAGTATQAGVISDDGPSFGIEDSGWLLYARQGSDTANPLAFAKIGKHLDDFDRHDILVI